MPVEVDVLARAESVAILRDRVAGLGAGHADRLAAQLRDLPLAVAQAAGFMAQIGTPTGQYLELLRMPHLLAASLATTGNPRLRWTACHACGYLRARGDTSAAHDLARDLRQQWRDRLGDDDHTVLAAARYLGWTLQLMGRYAEARDLHQDTWNRHRRILGEDHRNTLGYAHQFAIDLYQLGEVRAARDLDQDILDRSRRVLGEDDRDTLASASNLAAGLRALGEAEDKS